MKTFPHLTLCPHCDSVYHKQPCASGEIAICNRCAAVLWQGDGGLSARALPLTLSAAITFILACCYPVMSVGYHGATTEVTLWNAGWALAPAERFPLMAICTVFLLVAAPFLQVMMTAWLLLFARFGRPAPAFIFTMKALKWLHPWSRVEVGVLGFLVAAIKLSSLLEVSIGAGGWALAASCFLIIIVNNHDLQPLWDLLSYHQEAERE